MKYVAVSSGKVAMVDNDYPPEVGETVFTHMPYPTDLAAAFPEYAELERVKSLKAQISDLEATMTPRRIREALAGTDQGWLAALDVKIAALRAQLSAKTEV